MSVALCRMSIQERSKAIQRRTKIGEKDLKGLGYWGAYDAQKFIRRSKVEST